MCISSHLEGMLGIKDIVAANDSFQTLMSTELWQNLWLQLIWRAKRERKKPNSVLCIWGTKQTYEMQKGNISFMKNKIFMLLTYIKQKMECFLQGNYFLWWAPFMHDRVLNFWKPPWLFFSFFNSSGFNFRLINR